MKINAAGLELIKGFEGCELRAYKCEGGVWTIGYGSTRGVLPSMHITFDEADARLVDDLEDAEAVVEQYVDVELTEHQHAALVSLVFNIGAGNFRSSTLLRLLNNGDYVGAAQQFARWSKAGGQSMQGLVRRREAERALFLL